MSKNNIGQLKRGRKRHVISLLQPRPDGGSFGTRRDACRENKFRADALRADARADLSIAHAALRLADLLEADAGGEEESRSPASAVVMLRLRTNFACAGMEMIERNPDEPLSVVTLLPAGPNFVVPTLQGVKPKRLLEIVRADLNRSGAKKATGWLILALHGEFDDIAHLYRLHFHAVASGGMVDVMDKLRKLRKYRSKRQDLEKLRTAVDKPIKISRKPITNLPTTLAYVLQSFWPARSITESGDRLLRKQRTKRRIPSPQHTEVLLWLDQWELKDMILLMKIHVSKGRLKLSRCQKNVQFRRNG